MILPGMKKKSKERLRLDENDVLRLIKTELLNVNGMCCVNVCIIAPKKCYNILTPLRIMFNCKLQ